jgi:hypothetical protein
MHAERAKAASSVGCPRLGCDTLLDGAGGGEIGSPDDLAAFMASVRSGLDQSLANPQRLHGRWAQDLFRAILISLDAILMIKDEDTGELHSDPAEPLRIPDFRVVPALDITS